MSTLYDIPPDALIVDGYTIYYDNKVSAEQTIDEIFYQQVYAFHTNNPASLIIDGGSNIGIATLFFKKCYPAAKIICFEPDPVSFKLLEKNMVVNNLSNVTLFNAALSDIKGKAQFYGQVDVGDPDTRGNSLLPAWGLQRQTSSVIEVDAVPLSDYIQAPVDLLKLDIEGAEQKVLQALGDKLALVKEIILEFHEASAIQSSNSLEATIALLVQQNFAVTLLNKSTDCLPEATKKWAQSIQPTLYHLRALKKAS